MKIKKHIFSLATLSFLILGSHFVHAQSYCKSDVDVEVKLLCKMQAGFTEVALKDVGFDISTYKIPHSLKSYGFNYFIESQVYDFVSKNKSSLTAKAMWLSNETKDNPSCLNGSDTFFYANTLEAVLESSLLYLWNEYKNIYLTQELMDLPDDFEEEKQFKLLHVRHCFVRP